MQIQVISMLDNYFIDVSKSYFYNIFSIINYILLCWTLTIGIQFTDTSPISVQSEFHSTKQLLPSHGKKSPQYMAVLFHFKKLWVDTYCKENTTAKLESRIIGRRQYPRTLATQPNETPVILIKFRRQNIPKHPIALIPYTYPN